MGRKVNELIDPLPDLWVQYDEDRRNAVQVDEPAEQFDTGGSWYKVTPSARISTLVSKGAELGYWRDAHLDLLFDGHPTRATREWTLVDEDEITLRRHFYGSPFSRPHTEQRCQAYIDRHRDWGKSTLRREEIEYLAALDMFLDDKFGMLPGPHSPPSTGFH